MLSPSLTKRLVKRRFEVFENSEENLAVFKGVKQALYSKNSYQSLQHFKPIVLRRSDTPVRHNLLGKSLSHFTVGMNYLHFIVPRFPKNYNSQLRSLDSGDTVKLRGIGLSYLLRRIDIVPSKRCCNFAVR